VSAAPWQPEAAVCLLHLGSLRQQCVCCTQLHQRALLCWPAHAQHQVMHLTRSLVKMSGWLLWGEPLLAKPHHAALAAPLTDSSQSGTERSCAALLLQTAVVTGSWRSSAQRLARGPSALPAYGSGAATTTTCHSCRHSWRCAELTAPGGCMRCQPACATSSHALLACGLYYLLTLQGESL
jgi:hypothetical protein